MSRVRPILFNTDMTEAVLEEWKTATRRIIKPQPKADQTCKLGFCVAGDKRDIGKFAFGSNEQGGNILSVMPPCLPDDYLYVRETWAFIPCIECPSFPFGGERFCDRKPLTYADKDSIAEGCFIYRADYPQPKRITWRPSIHMPKTAARIWLKVKDVRVERLHDMTLDNFLKEGVRIPPEAFNDPDNAYLQARNRFIEIWDSTLPKGQQDLYSWAADPWVWTMEFERCRKPEKED